MKQPIVIAVSVLTFAYVVAAPGRNEPMNGVAAEPASASAPASRSARNPWSREPRQRKARFGTDDAMVLERDDSGQFHLAGQVDSQDTEFLVDTGADMVALTVEEADRLGLDVSPSEFAPLTQTASGVGNGAMVTIDRLEVAGKEFRDVPAAVLEGLPVNLLGQSVLRQLGQVSLEGDRMVIRH